jgi:NADH-quinone oxidoreductase subunit G
MKALLDLMRALGVQSTDCRQDGAQIGMTDDRASYLFNPTLEGITEADAILLVGTNPRLEATILNHRIRQAWLHNDAKIALIGEPVDLTYPYTHLGNSPAALKSLAEADHTVKAERPAILLGMGALNRPDSAAIVAAAAQLAGKTGVVKDGWNGWGLVHTAASRVGGLDMGFLPGEGGRDVAGILDGCETGEIGFVYLLGADELPMKHLKDAFVVYQGHHGDAGAHAADVVLPGAAYTEKTGLYVNLEGRVQQGVRAGFPPGDARDDWAIIRALSARMNATLAYDDVAALREKLFADAPSFAQLDYVEEGRSLDLDALQAGAGDVENSPLEYGVQNYYRTNPIARASTIMAQCEDEYLDPTPMAMAAE